MTKTHAARMNPPSGNVEFWDKKSARLLGFMGKPRSWTEIRAWGRARKLGTELHIDNQVAHLHNTRKVRMIDTGPVVLFVATVHCDTCDRRGWYVADRSKVPCACANARAA